MRERDIKHWKRDPNRLARIRREAKENRLEHEAMLASVIERRIAQVRAWKQKHLALYGNLRLTAEQIAQLDLGD